MGETAGITLRQLKTILHNQVRLYEPEENDAGRYTDLYCGEMKDAPEGLLDRKAYVIWARSGEHYEATVMIELEKEETA